MAETDEQLLARWRETLNTVRGFDGQDLDPVDRQTLNELRRQLERAEAELDRRGLRRTGQERDGAWQPLPMHEPAPPASAPQVELRWEPRDRLVPNSPLRILILWLDEAEDWPLIPEEVRHEWARERERELPFFNHSKPLTHRRSAAFVPSLADGLTSSQRLIFERLAHGSRSREQLVEAAPEGHDLARALFELELPRRYPLISESNGQLQLTPLARELVTVENGAARVHGTFFPNLLANGVADGLVFPTFSVQGIVHAASLLMEQPQTPTQDLLNTIGPCSPGAEWVLVRTSRSFGHTPGGAVCVLTEPRQWTQSKRLEFHFATAADAERASEQLRLAVEAQEFEEGTHQTIEAGTRLVVTLPTGIQGVRVMRRLMVERALESWWQVDTRCVGEDGVRPRAVRELLEFFVRRSRDEVLRKLRRERLPADDRLEVIEGLMRVAADERLAALVDAAETKDEAMWALTHLGSVELSAHPRLGRHARHAEPFSKSQARAIVSTSGLHRRLHLLTLERESLLEELSSRLSPLRASEVDRLVQERFAKVRKLAAEPSSRTHAE